MEKLTEVMGAFQVEEQFGKGRRWESPGRVMGGAGEPMWLGLEGTCREGTASAQSCRNRDSSELGAEGKTVSWDTVLSPGAVLTKHPRLGP